MHILRLADLSVPVSNQFSNSNSETTFGSAYQLGSNLDSGSNQGRTFKILALGYVSSTSSLPGTLTLKIKIGTTILGTAVFNLPSSLTNAGFWLDAVVIFCATGSSGLVSCQGFALLDNASAPVSAGIVNPGIGATGQISANTQVNQSINLTGTFSVASTGNVVTLSQMIVEEVI